MNQKQKFKAPKVESIFEQTQEKNRFVVKYIGLYSLKFIGVITKTILLIPNRFSSSSVDGHDPSEARRLSVKVNITDNVGNVVTIGTCNKNDIRINDILIKVIQINDIQLNDIQLNDIQMNYIYMNEFQINKIQISNIQKNGNQKNANLKSDILIVNCNENETKKTLCLSYGCETSQLKKISNLILFIIFFS